MAIKISRNRVDMGSTPIKNVQYQGLDQITTPAAPDTGKTRFYSKTDGSLYVVPAAGSETAVGGSIPANLIAHTTATTAPSGWTEYTAGRGRVLVGTPLSGTAGGTVGTALTDLQNPTHTHTGPSHTHSQNTSAYGNGGSGWPPSTSALVAASSSADGTGIYNLNDAGGGSTTRYYPTLGVSAAGTGATGATSATMPYVQLLGIQKS